MTPDVERQLWRAAGSFVEALSRVTSMIFYAAGAAATALGHRADICQARADVLETDLVSVIDDEDDL